MTNGTMTKGNGASTPHAGLGKLTAAPAVHDDLVGKPTEAGSDLMAKVVEIKDKVVDVKDAALAMKDKVLKRGSKMVVNLRRMVVANPLKAVAIAFGIGYVGMRVTRPLRWL